MADKKMTDLRKLILAVMRGGGALTYPVAATEIQAIQV